MSARLDSSLLAAYADGQLSDEETAKVERQLADSPEDRRTVEVLREMNAHLAAAFDAPLRGPLPQGILAQLTKAGRSRGFPTWWPVAAGSALAAASLVAGYLGGFSPPADPGLLAGEIARSSSFHALLDSGRDGDATNLGSGTATLGTTFVDGRGAPCRDVEWSEGAGASPMWALACRRGEDWLVEMTIARPAAGVDTPDTYVPAAGATAEVMDAALHALDAGPVLGPDEVDHLIENDWESQ